MNREKPNIFLFHHCSNRVASARFLRKVLYRLRDTSAIQLNEYPFSMPDNTPKSVGKTNKCKLIQTLFNKRPDILLLGDLSAPWIGELISFAGMLRIRTVTVLTDLNPPISFTMSDACIVPSLYLRERLEARFPGMAIFVIPDIIEVDSYDVQKNRTDRLILGWIGHQDNWSQVKIIQKWLQQKKWPVPLITISSHPEATVQWQIDTWHKALNQATVGVLPVPYSPWNWCKSENRAATMLALGLPVIASPVPSYKRLSKDIPALKIARNGSEFIETLKYLKNAEIRERLIQGVPEHIQNRFGLHVVTEQWLDAFRKIKRLPVRPKLNFLIPMEMQRFQRYIKWR